MQSFMTQRRTIANGCRGGMTKVFETVASLYICLLLGGILFSYDVLTPLLTTIETNIAISLAILLLYIGLKANDES